MASRGINRRQFLRLSAAVAAAGAVTACGGDTTAPTPTKSATGSTTASSPAAAAANPTAAGAAPTLAVSNAAAPTTAAAAAAPTKFKEAPMVADMVKAGKVPAVELRLPTNPRVIKPRESAGVYGGIWHRQYRGLSDRVGPTKLNEQPPIQWEAPDPNTVRLVANWVEKWDQSADATEYTFYIRKGLKWSDGTEVTTDDTQFSWDDVQQNKDIRPVPADYMRQRIGSEYKTGALTVMDKYTFKVKYAHPYPLLPILIAKNNGGPVGQVAFLSPSKYLKQFHPKYATPDALAKAVADKKVKTWVDLWGDAGQMEGPIPFFFLNPELPVIHPWKIVNPTPADPVVMERNPFFGYVDPDGNQLPYIDRIEHALIDNNDVLNLRIAGGQIDMQYRNVSLGSYTFLKENEAKGNYKVLRWRSASTDAYFPNLNCPDPVLAKLFNMADFRQALSISIDRKSINELVWNGLGKARQASPVPGSPEYDADLEKVWTEYDVKKANDLLDKIGLTKNADGSRKRPDGQSLEVTVEHIDTPGSPAEDAHNRVKKYWDAIGVKTNIKFVERSLYTTHVNNGELQIGQWGFDRCSVVKADPGRWLGSIDDGPWAPNYGHWYLNNAFKKEEPPQDHPIRQIWALWDKTQVEPDEVKRNALFQQILDIHKQAPYAIGTVGEKVQPVIVSNAFHNMPDGFIADDTLRDYGLVYPSQFYIKK